MEQVANGGLNVFGCHYNNGNLCRGWIDCHGAGNLLALKLADCITPEMFTEPKAEVYESGAAVLAANLPHMDNPAPDALAMVEMLKRIPGKILLDGTPAS
jgi:hypothetical protein